MRRLIFRPSAQRDLADLYQNIRDRTGAPDIAIGYVRRIRAYCEGFVEFPERGIKRDDIRPGLRIAGFERRVAIAFTFDADHVRIGRIFYGGRDYQTLLGATNDDAETPEG